MPPRTMHRIPSHRIAELLRPEANNLDLVRLLCATLVIYGHSSPIFGPPNVDAALADPSLMLGYEGVYSGSIAVKIFFFISGLLVTTSLLTKRSVVHFVVARALRIWPALAVATLGCAFVLGPLLTEVGWPAYFGSATTYRYVLGNLLFHHVETLPAVFSDHWVNGSLWSLRYEVGAYLIVLILGLLGVLRSRILCSLLLAVFFIDPMLSGPFSRWLGGNPQIIFLPPCFALGAWVAVNRERIVLSPALLLALTAGFFLLRQTIAGPLAFLTLLFALVLYLAGLPWFIRLRPAGDLSYGTFLWGFPVQQTVAKFFPAIGFFGGFAASLAVALVLAWISWKLVEAPAIRIGRRLAARTATPPAPGRLAEEWGLGWVPRILLALALVPLPWLVAEAEGIVAGKIGTRNASAWGLSAGLAEKLNIHTPYNTTLGPAQIRWENGHWVLMALPPAHLQWKLEGTPCAVSFTFGIDPAAYEQGATNGADLIIELQGRAFPRRVYYRHLDPVHVPADRGPQHVTFSLPAFEPGARLFLRTTPGEFNNGAWDWIYISQFRLLPLNCWAVDQFPNFSRIPTAVTGDTTSVLRTPARPLGIFAATPTSLSFALHGAERQARLQLRFMSTAYEQGGRTDGVLVRFILKPRTGESIRLHEQLIDPLNVPAHRGSQFIEASLQGHRPGDTLVVELLPYGNPGWDQLILEQFSIQ